MKETNTYPFKVSSPLRYGVSTCKRFLKLLKEKKINNKISVKDALLQLSKIYLTDIGDKIIMAEIPKKVRELAEILELKPELFPKNVPS